MSVNRVTDMKHTMSHEESTLRARESTPGISYIVCWSSDNKWKGRPRHIAHHNGKPTNRLSEATRQYEQHAETALFVEIREYSDESIRVIRRFCNLGRYRKMYGDVDYILKEDNPPFEIRDDVQNGSGV